MNCLEFQHPHLCVVLLFVNAKQHLAVLSFWGQESGSRTQGGNFSRPTITLAADKPNLLINALGAFPSFTTKESTSPFRAKRLTLLTALTIKCEKWETFYLNVDFHIVIRVKLMLIYWIDIGLLSRHMSKKGLEYWCQRYIARNRNFSLCYWLLNTRLQVISQFNFWRLYNRVSRKKKSFLISSI